MRNIPTEDRILWILKEKDDFISGEELSHRLGLSRMGIWKAIQRIKLLGYSVVAQPHLGYRLIEVPDRLIPFELTWNLKTKSIGKSVLSFKKIESTNNTAYELATNGAREGTVVFAEEQTKGKGRLGRSWLSPAYKGIYMSVILRPNIAPSSAPELTLIATLAVTKAIRELTGLLSFIKWPNDVVINSKKVCGILTEMNAEIDKVNFLIVGIGINVNSEKKDLPKEASSIKEELKQRISRIELARLILLRLDEYYEIFKEFGFNPPLAEIKRYSSTLNRRVKVHYLNRFIEGHAQDIDKDGALLVRLDNGFAEKVFAGDLVNIR
ncbi:MAG: biotin--[acetyl-CoA-carboxylase] ligase [Candidatus Omnitrophica bacterium]|nr:biotin--[acetyl-CoA-carboxylase] ligase [Candidatus Omnitrophota bacterium]